MSDAGRRRPRCRPVNLTFDDEAAAPLPDSDPIVNGGTYRAVEPR